jgi:hypothetical protein
MPQGYTPDIRASCMRLAGYHMLVDCIVVVLEDTVRDYKVVDSQMRRLLDIGAGSQLGGLLSKTFALARRPRCPPAEKLHVAIPDCLRVHTQNMLLRSLLQMRGCPESVGRRQNQEILHRPQH